MKKLSILVVSIITLLGCATEYGASEVFWFTPRSQRLDHEAQELKIEFNKTPIYIGIEGYYINNEDNHAIKDDTYHWVKRVTFPYEADFGWVSYDYTEDPKVVKIILSENSTIFRRRIYLTNPENPCGAEPALGQYMQMPQYGEYSNY